MLTLWIVLGVMAALPLAVGAGLALREERARRAAQQSLANVVIPIRRTPETPRSSAAARDLHPLRQGPPLAAFAGPSPMKKGSRGLATYVTYPTLPQDDNIVHFTRLFKGVPGSIPPGFEWTVALSFPDGDTQVGYLPADPATGGPSLADLLLRVDVAEMEYLRRTRPAVDA